MHFAFLAQAYTVLLLERIPKICITQILKYDIQLLIFVSRLQEHNKCYDQCIHIALSGEP